MKVYFASLDDLTVTIDSWVSNVEQGAILLESLAERFKDHTGVVARARVKFYENYEERYIGPPSGRDFDNFMHDVRMMGRREP